MPTIKFIVGLTGGLASGKSVLSDYFSSMNVDILDADMIVRRLHQDPGLQHSIHQQFGNIDRATLRELIFNDQQAKQWLEQLLHPLVMQNISQWKLSITGQYGILVAPLLIETGLYQRVNRVLVVDCDQSLQLIRATKRDQITPELAGRIIAQQASREQRLLFADDIIINHGSITELQAQAKTLHDCYLQFAREA
jgi:dephospho-CoA kinase